MNRDCRKVFFTEAEREFLIRTHALVIDAQGGDILAGLTTDETATYMAICNRALVGHVLPPEERAKEEATYLELRARHEAARKDRALARKPE